VPPATRPASHPDERDQIVAFFPPILGRRFRSPGKSSWCSRTPFWTSGRFDVFLAMGYALHVHAYSLHYWTGGSFIFLNSNGHIFRQYFWRPRCPWFATILADFPTRPPPLRRSPPVRPLSWLPDPLGGSDSRGVCPSDILAQISAQTFAFPPPPPPCWFLERWDHGHWKSPVAAFLLLIGGFSTGHNLG